MDYFSDRENGPKARTIETITPQVWGGIVAIVQAAVVTGGFGQVFPEGCPDGKGPIGTDETALSRVLRAEIPELDWPLRETKEVEQGLYSTVHEPFAPEAVVVLDFIEFCYRNIATPVQGSFHTYFDHHHLSFDVSQGQEEFRNSINRIFSRNGLAYELSPNGHVVRLVPPVLRETMAGAPIQTGDAQLDRLLEEARRRFLSPKFEERRIALEKLWDCWERIKSLEAPENKRASVAKLLEQVSPEINFRSSLEKEARELTEIGNSFHIRHSEVGQQPLSHESHIDYLFHRMYAMIMLLLRKH